MSFPRRRESRGGGACVGKTNFGMELGHAQEAVLRLHPCQQEKRAPSTSAWPPTCQRGSISIRMTWWPALPRNTGYTTWPQLPGATDDVNAAITREKQLKKWERAWKIRLIEERNPGWEDLYPLIG